MVRTNDRIYSQSSVNDSNIVSKQALSSPLFSALSQRHFQQVIVSASRLSKSITRLRFRFKLLKIPSVFQPAPFYFSLISVKSLHKLSKLSFSQILFNISSTVSVASTTSSALRSLTILFSLNTTTATTFYNKPPTLADRRLLTHGLEQMSSFPF